MTIQYLYFEMFKEAPITQGASGMFFDLGGMRHGGANKSEAGETVRLRFMCKRWVTLFWPH